MCSQLVNDVIDIVLVPSFLILNRFRNLCLSLVLTFKRKFFAEKDHNKKKLLKTRFYLLFNFAVTKIRVAIPLVEDGTRMGGI